MSTRTILVLFLAITFGACAAMGVSHLRPLAGNSDVQERQPVVTAAADVFSGQELGAKNLKLAHYRPQDVPKGALTSIDDAMGRTALVPLGTGEPVVNGKVTGKGAGSGLAVMVPDGMRAFTIQTPQLSGQVGGFIKVGNRVDVLLTTTPVGGNDPTEGGVTTTLLQNIKVLAVAQKVEGVVEKKSDDKKSEPDETQTIADVKSVTLLVTPDQAAKLDLGMNRGLLHLSLRNPADHRQAQAAPATMRDLRFHSGQPLALLDALRRLAIPAGVPAAPAAPQVASASKEIKKEVAQPVYMEIRTLRGLDAGSVRVQARQ
jgi:pilus assembly protein CpaB